MKMSKKIYLNKTIYTLVDNEDYHFLNQWNWSLSINGYAFRQPYIKKSERINNKKYEKMIFLHRLVMDCSDNLSVDHINHNKLDNRKSNLRNVSHLVNMNNMSKHKDNKSGYKGVFQNYHEVTRKKIWRARLTFNGIVFELGLYETPKEAHNAYIKKSIELRGL